MRYWSTCFQFGSHTLFDASLPLFEPLPPGLGALEVGAFAASLISILLDDRLEVKTMIFPFAFTHHSLLRRQLKLRRHRTFEHRARMPKLGIEGEAISTKTASLSCNTKHNLNNNHSFTKSI